MTSKVIRVGYKIFTQNLFRTAYVEHFQCCRNHFWGKLNGLYFFTSLWRPTLIKTVGYQPVIEETRIRSKASLRVLRFGHSGIGKVLSASIPVFPLFSYSTNVPYLPFFHMPQRYRI